PCTRGSSASWTAPRAASCCAVSCAASAVARRTERPGTGPRRTGSRVTAPLATAPPSRASSMPRPTSVYRCQQCGFASPKAGTCPDCKRATGELVPLVEERAAPAPGGRRAAVAAGSRPTRLADVTLDGADRTLTGIGGDGVLLWAENDLTSVQAELDTIKPRALVIDSIQTVFLPDLESAPGSVAQVRECGARLMTLAKGRGIATFLVGHVTKEGALAGPRVLEHLVDTVLYFEGEQHHAYRVLRAVKNRFGSTNEIGVFEMATGGLVEVPNPSGFFLAERPADAPGSVVVSALEGTRPLLLELQALVTRASFGTPRRTVLGADYNRVCLLLAVLEKRAGLPIGGQDVFVNVAGGGRVAEPAADLGVVIAAASSYLERPVAPDVLVLGEVGLTGEVRAVNGVEVRLRAAAQLGFKSAVVPRSNVEGALPLSVKGVATVSDALGALLG